MVFGKGEWRDFNEGLQKEWLLTNGIGGYACSTIIGVNTRRYHGLLVASLKPPVQRNLVLSKLDEVLEIAGESYDLSTNQTIDYISNGYIHLQTVEVDKVITYNYNVKDVFIEKKISMIYGKNSVAIVYSIINGLNECNLKVYPLINFRDHHSNSSREWLNFQSEICNNGVNIIPNYGETTIQVKSSEGKFLKFDDTWFYNMDYQIEHERGLSATEDLYMPGYFEINLKPEEEKVVTIIASIEDIKDFDGQRIIKKEEERIGKLIKSAGFKDEFINDLVMAADKFIVYRESTEAKTVIAGYPWFTDWGRDTMIAFTGLTLVTKRFEEAKEILTSFAKYINKGLVPNMFPDGGNDPIYNTVDASLWFFEAVYKYVEYTNDYKFIGECIYPKLEEIIEYYKNGTLFNIKMDDDGLINAGDESIQLTWMDAKIGDWVVTPRYGKAVEINALWYNALKIMEFLAKSFNGDSAYYYELAETVKSSFDKFWNPEVKCLYDVINKNYCDGRVRPNQILAVSLSFPVLEGDKAKEVVHKVLNELYTSMGLRSLSPKDKEYVGVYTGDQLKRDSAYHEGTVWGWLMGPFITAYKRVNSHGEEHKHIYEKFLEPIKEHLNDACVGQISEIFDGDEPLIPRGCFAQAWSVAEVLRAFTEDPERE